MTIAEVSKKYGVSADTLRYYERIGLIPPFIELRVESVIIPMMTATGSVLSNVCVLPD